MRPLSPLVVATLLALFQQGVAQETGDRIRLTLGPGASHQLVGGLVGQNPDSLWVALPGRAAPVAVARRRAARLEVSRGWDRATIRGGEGASAGGGGGGGGGGAGSTPK